MEKYKEIEKSIIKKYRKQIWGKFLRALKDFELINESDKILVCVSGGKDSMLLAKCIEELKKHSKVNFEYKIAIMNPGYNKENLNLIIDNCKILNIDPIIFDSDIFNITENIDGNPCYLCARMRRGILYNKARELGYNKIALGHHFNDVIETIMLNILYTGQYSSMMPKLKSDNFPGIELIRPMYYIKEDDIISWAKYNDLKFINCACKLSKNKEKESKRYLVKKIIEDLKKFNKDVDWCIYKSSCNVNLNTIISYKDGTKKISFLDKYNDKNNKM